MLNLVFALLSLFPTLPQAAPPPLRPALLAPPAVEPLNAAEFRQLLAQHQGKVILVNLWATWCAPCLKELPELAKLQQQYREKGLVVLAISLDEPELLDTQVKRLARERAAGLATYLQIEPSTDKFVSVVDKAWAEIMPTNYLLDRTGKVQAKLTGGKSYAEFEAALKPLL